MDICSKLYAAMDDLYILKDNIYKQPSCCQLCAEVLNLAKKIVPAISNSVLLAKVCHSVKLTIEAENLEEISNAFSL